MTVKKKTEPAEKKRGPGRLSTYSKDVATKICERLETGEPLLQILRTAGMPKPRTVYLWQEAHPEFATQFARARDIGFDAIAEDALRIADTPIEGIRREESEQGVKEVHEDMLGHRKLQVETRLKLLAKWSPKKYGDKQQVEHSGTMTLESIVSGGGEK